MSTDVGPSCLAFARHALPEDADPRPDLLHSLCPRGRRQAEGLAEFLGPFFPRGKRTVILCPPVRRVVQTAGYVSRKLGSPIVLERRLGDAAMNVAARRMTGVILRVEKMARDAPGTSFIFLLRQNSLLLFPRLMLAALELDFSRGYPCGPSAGLLVDVREGFFVPFGPFDGPGREPVRRPDARC